MKPLWAIATREYASLFRIPIGWVAVALFLLLSAYLFTRYTLIPGQPASMRVFFGAWWILLVILAPLISMRLFSEELRTGTIEPLLTAPATELQIVLGKYAGAVMFLVTMLAPTLLFVLILELVARPDYGPIIAGYVGIVLVGMLYLAIGTLISAMTSSQMLAGLGTFFILIAMDVLMVEVGKQLPAQLSSALYSLAPNIRVADFAKGLINTSDIAFFLIGTAWLLGLSAIVLESRRWR